MSEWKPIESAPQGVPVRTVIRDQDGERNEGVLIRDGRLWWLPGGSVYVYYTPTHWREADGGAAGERVRR